jgi:hypothetical protein
MASDLERNAALDRIRQNIAHRGFYAYVVTGGGDPHYAYTIGLINSLGAELVLAGAYFYLVDDVVKIIESVAAELKPPVAWETQQIDLGSWGVFSLRRVHTSWVTTLMLGALDFYQVK